MYDPYVTQERERFELLKFTVRTYLAEHEVRLHRPEFVEYMDYVANAFVFELRGLLYGKEGRPVRVEEDVTVAHLPSWLPRWLQRRWSEKRKIVLDAEPKLVWPEANYVPPDFGRGVEFVHWRHHWADGEEDDVLAGWI